MTLARRAVADGLGTALLLAIVVGSGIMAHRMTDDVALQLDHAAFEHREQADRSGADDDNVGLVVLAIGHAAKMGETAGK